MSLLVIGLDDVFLYLILDLFLKVTILSILQKFNLYDDNGKSEKYYYTHQYVL